MTANITDGVLELKSSSYPTDEYVIRRKSDGFVFGCVVYTNANRHTENDFEEIIKTETEENETE